MAHGLDVTGLDLNPAMIGRARASADRLGNGGDRRPSLLVGDVAALALPRRVLRPGRHHSVDVLLTQPNGPAEDSLRGGDLSGLCVRPDHLATRACRGLHVESVPEDPSIPPFRQRP